MKYRVWTIFDFNNWAQYLFSSYTLFFGKKLQNWHEAECFHFSTVSSLKMFLLCSYLKSAILALLTA